LNIDDEREMIQWAINNCDSFIYKTIKDIRKEDYYDSLHEFFFLEEKDAMWFRLHWQ
jgi:hypothetical protein